MLGQRIRQFRKINNFSQEILGQLLKMQQSQISKIETGQRAVDAGELKNIAAALGVTVAKLLEEEKEARN